MGLEIWEVLSISCCLVMYFTNYTSYPEAQKAGGLLSRFFWGSVMVLARSPLDVFKHSSLILVLSHIVSLGDDDINVPLVPSKGENTHVDSFLPTALHLISHQASQYSLSSVSPLVTLSFQVPTWIAILQGLLWYSNSDNKLILFKYLYGCFCFACFYV